MKKRLQFAALMMVLMVFASCSQGITGTWKIVNYEERTTGKSTVSLANIGTMTFNKDGSGTKEISYSIMGIPMQDNLPFTWKQEGNTVTISGDESEFAKAWIVLEAKRKSQIWKSTDGTDEIHRLTLTK